MTLETLHKPAANARRSLLSILPFLRLIPRSSETPILVSSCNWSYATTTLTHPFQEQNKMKFTTSIIVVAVQVAAALAARTTANTGRDETCGTLGVMDASDSLSAGATTENVRKCAEHPLTNGTLPGLSEDKENSASKCYFDAPYGCSDGYCWKACGNNGEWCWTAKNGGTGDWYTCSASTQCGDSDTYACGQGCSSCGCSC